MNCRILRKDIIAFGGSNSIKDEGTMDSRKVQNPQTTPTIASPGTREPDRPVMGTKNFKTTNNNGNVNKNGTIEPSTVPLQADVRSSNWTWRWFRSLPEALHVCSI